MLLYSLLHLTGYADMTMDQIEDVPATRSRCAGHPERGHADGIEVTTGPLGQGIANSVGMALAERMLATHFGKDLVDHYTYVLLWRRLPDGGDQPRSDLLRWPSEAVEAHPVLGRQPHLDRRSDRTSRQKMSCFRFNASGWHTQRIDGHDTNAIADAIVKAQQSDKPSMIACRTIIAFGAPTKANTAAAHGAALGKDEIAGARVRLGWTLAAFRRARRSRRIVERSRRPQQEGFGGVARTPCQIGPARRLRSCHVGRLAEIGDRRVGRDQVLVTHSPTRRRPRRVKLPAACSMPWHRRCSGLVGGSADLTPSNNTKAKSQKILDAGDYDGSYIHYGIREHGMAATMNGLQRMAGSSPMAARS